MSGFTPAPRLKSGIWADALIRRAQAGGAFACVVTRGDRDAGTVLVCVRGREGLRLYTPERDMDGVRVWRGEALDEDALKARLSQRLDFDPDLMVVEIDDPRGRHFIEETVMGLPDAPAATVEAAANQEPASQEERADAAAAARALFRDR